MMRRVAFSLLILVASPATAQFEGRADYALRSAKGGDGHLTLLVSRNGARSELKMAGGPRVTTLVRAAERRRVYLINDDRKTFSVTDVPTDAGRDEAKYKVERTGRDRIGGHGCETAVVSGDGVGHVEACVTKEFGVIPMISAIRGGGKGNFFAALDSAGLAGLPVRWKTFDAAGNLESTVELESVRREDVAAEKLAVPVGYQQGTALDALATPEQKQRIEEAMRRAREQMQRLPPEQRDRGARGKATP